MALCPEAQALSLQSSYLVKVLLSGSHLLPGLVEEQDADAEELIKNAVLREEDGVIVRAGLRRWGRGERGDQ